LEEIREEGSEAEEKEGKREEGEREENWRRANEVVELVEERRREVILSRSRDLRLARGRRRVSC
jgi:hypothetical protein